ERGEHDQYRDGEQGGAVQKAAAVKCLRQKDSGECAGHKDFAVREVNHEQDAVDEGIAKSDQGVDTALRQPGNDQTDPLIRGETTRRERVKRANEDQCDDNDTQDADSKIDPGKFIECTLIQDESHSFSSEYRMSQQRAGVPGSLVPT